MPVQRDLALPRLDPTRASIALLIGGAMWGLYWIPVRMLVERGLPGPWAGAVLYLGALAVLLPFAMRDRAALIASWRFLAVGGLLTGAAFSLWTTSLAYTDVLRAILLFYLTPVWGTLLGLAFLGERLTLRRALGLLLGLGGLTVVLGTDGALPWPRNGGDWLALASGIAWAVGTMRLYQGEVQAPVAQGFAFLAGALVVAGLSATLLGTTTGETVTLGTVTGYLPFALVAAAYMLPMVFLTLWPASVLSPGRVGLLLMSEVVVGVVSAAILTGEPFGWREAVGTALIVGAAISEVVGVRRA